MGKNIWGYALTLGTVLWAFEYNCKSLKMVEWFSLKPTLQAMILLEREQEEF